MAELLPPEEPINGGVAGGGRAASIENLGPSLGTKRQRRPSVRLGDIGDQPALATLSSYDSYVRRTSKLWSNESSAKYHQQNHHHRHHNLGKSSKTRPLTNIGNGGGGGGEDSQEKTLENEEDGGNLDLLPNRKSSKRGTKRVRSNWGATSKLDDEQQAVDEENSPSRDSLENPVIDGGHNGNEKEDGLFLGQTNRPVRAAARVSSASRDHEDGPSDNDAWNPVQKGRFWSLDEGIRMWLDGLGLGKYAAVFEIHEVDEDVLPMLTLEDLKDMGINAVGSRRKLYCAIQKLAKGFS